MMVAGRLRTFTELKMSRLFLSIAALILTLMAVSSTCLAERRIWNRLSNKGRIGILD